MARNLDGSGSNSSNPPAGDVRAALARDMLRRFLSTPFGGDGRVPGFTPAEVRDMLAAVAERPDWALPVLRELGIGADASARVPRGQR